MIWAAVVLVGLAQPADPFTVLDAAAQSVVRVEADGCPEGGRRATGFVWGQADWVVTALHVVVGCPTVKVYFERASKRRDVDLIRVLRLRDLALLQVRPRVPGTPETIAPPLVPSEVRTQQGLVALGYPLGIAFLGSAQLALRFQLDRKLATQLPPPVFQVLNTRMSPDPGGEVVPLDGHLLPGFSGAPILDLNGKVVAVADGGLKGGEVSISWGIPTTHLAALAASNEKPPLDLGAAADLFSVPAGEVFEPPTPEDLKESNKLLTAGRKLMQAGQAEEAMDRLMTAQRLNPGDPWIWAELAHVARKLGDTTTARRCAHRALELTIDGHVRALVLFSAGAAEMDDGQLASARPFLEESMCLRLFFKQTGQARGTWKPEQMQQVGDRLSQVLAALGEPPFDAETRCPDFLHGAQP